MLNSNVSGSTIPIVSHIAIKKVIKKSSFAYVIFAKEKNLSMNEHFSTIEHTRLNFLKNYEGCFADTLLGSLPPERPGDHSIDLIPGSSPPYELQHRVSSSQQEEITTQVNELLEKGLIRLNSSPYCSLVLLVQNKDGTFRTCIDYRSLNKIR